MTSRPFCGLPYSDATAVVCHRSGCHARTGGVQCMCDQPDRDDQPQECALPRQCVEKSDARPCQVAACLQLAASEVSSSRCVFSRRPLLPHTNMPLSHWKMTLIAVARGLLFIASGERVLVLPTEPTGVPLCLAARLRAEDLLQQQQQHLDEDSEDELDSSVALLQLQRREASIAEVFPRQNEILESHYRFLDLPAAERAGADEDDDDVGRLERDITVLRVVAYGAHTLLAATTMDGRLVLFDVDHLDLPSIVRKLARPNWDDNSAWSIACTPRNFATPTLIVGTNAHYAFLVRLESAATTASNAAATPAATSSSPTPSFISAGHNIPSVDVSSCGQFLAMSCIDSLVRIARIDHAAVASGAQLANSIIAVKEVDSSWGWSVRWITARSIRTWPVSLAAVEAHEAHATVPEHIRLLQSRPGPASAGDRRNEDLIEHMVAQLVEQMRATGVPIADRDRELFRQHLRGQLRGDAPGGEDDEENQGEEDDDMDADLFAEDEIEADEEEIDMDDFIDEDDADADDLSMPPLREDDDEDEQPRVPHDEMGWEAGFEAEPHVDELSDDEDATAPAEVAAPTAISSVAAPTLSVAPPSAATSSPPSSRPLPPSQSRARTLGTPKMKAKSKPQPVLPLPTDLLIYASKLNVYLLDAQLNVLCSVANVCRPTLTIHRTLDRLIFVEWLPEVSCLLLASGACDRVLVYRLNRYACGGYRMEVLQALPSVSCGRPIKGVTVERVRTQQQDESRAPLSLQHTLERADDHTTTSTLSDPSDSSLPSAVPCPTSQAAVLLRQLTRYRVYVLFADETVGAYELTLQDTTTDFDQ